MIIAGGNMSSKKKDFVKAKVHCVLTPGEALKMLRELQGLSQVELAQATGMSQSNISALECGAKNIGRERALILAKALHVHPAVLMFPDFDMKQVA
jgi:transcriptional regulator with XRE-family HTH domain